MCFAKQPEPDINKPAYTPDQIDQNMTLTAKDTKTGTTSTIDQSAVDASATKVNKSAPIARTSGIRMKV